MRIDLPVPLPVPAPPPHHPLTPAPPPHHPPGPDPKSLPQRRRWELAALCENYPRESARINGNYPLARNQYISNSPGIFCCIRAGANTGAACYIVFAPNEFPQEFGKIFGKYLLKNIFLYPRKCEYKRRMHLRKTNSPRVFSCMYWFCAGG